MASLSREAAGLIALTLVNRDQRCQRRTSDTAARRPSNHPLYSTCQAHGCRGFCNLRVSKVNSEIVLDPHVDGSCVISLDREGAAVLRDLLTEWLG